MEQNQYYAFVGTNSVRGSEGIYSICIDAETLVPTVVSTRQEYNVGAIKLPGSGEYLYAGCEGMTFRGRADGGIAAYRVLPDGRLEDNGYAYAHGQRICAIDTDERISQAYTASFFNGTVAICGIDRDGRLQPARKVVESRDNPDFPPFMPKGLHCVRAIGDRYFGVISIVEGSFIVYSVEDGRRVAQYVFPEHTMIRWLETCGRYVYALLQSPGDIYVFRNDLDKDGTIPLIQVTSILPDGAESRFDSTTIHATPDGSIVMAASRAENALSLFQVLEDGKLELKNVVTLPGETPRDFNISKDGKIVVAACQKSDEVCVLKIDYENYDLIYREGCKVSVPSPAAVAVSGLM